MGIFVQILQHFASYVGRSQFGNIIFVAWHSVLLECSTLCDFACGFCIGMRVVVFVAYVARFMFNIIVKGKFPCGLSAGFWQCFWHWVASQYGTLCNFVLSFQVACSLGCVVGLCAKFWHCFSHWVVSQSGMCQNFVVRQSVFLVFWWALWWLGAERRATFLIW